MIEIWYAVNMTKGMSPVKLFGNNIYFRYLLMKKSPNLLSNMKFDLVCTFLYIFVTATFYLLKCSATF